MNIKKITSLIACYIIMAIGCLTHGEDKDFNENRCSFNLGNPYSFLCRLIRINAQFELSMENINSLYKDSSVATDLSIIQKNFAGYRPLALFYGVVLAHSPNGNDNIYSQWDKLISKVTTETNNDILLESSEIETEELPLFWYALLQNAIDDFNYMVSEYASSSVERINELEMNPQAVRTHKCYSTMYTSVCIPSKKDPISLNELMDYVENTWVKASLPTTADEVVAHLHKQAEKSIEESMSKQEL